MIKYFRSILLSGLILAGGVTVAAQTGPASAQIQAALRAFIAQIHTWTATQTFTNIVVNGTCTGCGVGAPTDATYITQIPNASLSAEQALSALATGILKSTTTTGILSIAVVGTDYQSPTGTPAGFVIASQATGDLLYASSATAWARLADVATGSVLKSGGIGVAPAWSTLASSFLSDAANVLKLDGGQTITNAVWNAGAVTTSGNFTYGGNSAANGGLVSTGANGLPITASNAAGTIRFYCGGTTECGRFDATDGRFWVGTTSSIGTGFSIFSGNFSTYNGVVFNDTSSGSGVVFANFTLAGTAIGSIQRTGATSAVQYNVASDIRLKNDQGVAQDLSGLRSLVVHDFTWKGDTSGYIDRGVFAQDVYRTMQRGVTPGDDVVDAKGHLINLWKVNYPAYIPDLIVGWQTHNGQISALEARIAALESALHQQVP